MEGGKEMVRRASTSTSREGRKEGGRGGNGKEVKKGGKEGERKDVPVRLRQNLSTSTVMSCSISL